MPPGVHYLHGNLSIFCMLTVQTNREQVQITVFSKTLKRSRDTMVSIAPLITFISYELLCHHLKDTLEKFVVNLDCLTLCFIKSVWCW